MKKWTTPVTLENDLVRLEPIEAHHKAGLIESVSDGKLYELWFTSVPSPPGIPSYSRSLPPSGPRSGAICSQQQFSQSVVAESVPTGNVVDSLHAGVDRVGMNGEHLRRSQHVHVGIGIGSQRLR